MHDELVRVQSVSKAKGRSMLDRRPRFVLRSVTLKIDYGEAVGLTGSNGSGKTTLARMIAGLEEPDEGTITVAGEDPASLLRRDRRKLSELIAMVPQEQTNAIDPLLTVETVLSEPFFLRGHRQGASELLAALAEVGLPEDALGRRSGELSTGQRQRVALARALSGTPKLLILDEATTALDDSTRHLVVNVLKARRSTAYGLAMLVIEHDARLINSLVDRTVSLDEGIR